MLCINVSRKCMHFYISYILLDVHLCKIVGNDYDELNTVIFKLILNSIEFKDVI